MKAGIIFRTSIIIIIINIMISVQANSQTGSSVIYQAGNNVIDKFDSFKLPDNPQRQIYIRLGCSQQTPPPNFTGSHIRLNRQNETLYTPYNSLLNSHWVYEGFNGFWSCNPVGHFVVSPFDSIIIKHSDEIVSDCCGPVQINKIYWGLFSSQENSIEVPEYSTFCGMDVDTTSIFGEAEYYYAYKLNNSFNNIVNAVIKVYIFSGGFIDQDVTDTIPGLKNFSDGGFLKVNPFNRDYIFLTADKLMLSTSSGTNFFSVNIPSVNKLIFSEQDRAIYGYTSSKLYRSTDNGLNWDSVSLPENFNIVESDPDNSLILYAGNQRGLFRSVDKGHNWNLYNNSFSLSTNIIGISKDNLSGDTLIVCTDAQLIKVWSPELVGINGFSSIIPDKYTLSQNYPNPFNPSTNLEFGISELGFVSLKIYDGLGREVQTLVNEQLAPGTYNYQFSTINYPLSSGVYFYRLEAGSFVETKRMVLLK